MVDSTPTGVAPPSTIRSTRPSQIGKHVRGHGRRDMAGAVGRRRHHRPAEAGEERSRHRMIGHAHRDGIEPGRRQIGHRASGRFAQHQRQRSRPERCGEPRGFGGELRQRVRRGKIGHMRDQRVERRPPLGRIEPRHRLAIAGVGAEPVNRLGRKGDEPAGGQNARGLRDRSIVGAQNPRRQRGRRLGRRPCHCGTLVPKCGLRNLAGRRLAGAGCRRYKPPAPCVGQCRSVAQPGRAPRSGRGGRRFKSCHSDQPTYQGAIRLVFCRATRTAR